VLLNIWRREPLQTLYYRDFTMKALVDETLSQGAFEAVYVHLFRMAPYVIDRGGLYRIVDLTDVISREIAQSLSYRDPLTRWLFTLERGRVARYEQKVAERFEEVWFISDTDREVLRASCPDANLVVVRNGVDTEQFFPTDLPHIPDRLIFVGHMGVFHNVDAAQFLVQEIIPLVRNQIPECDLDLVGASPAPEVTELQRQPGVTVTGYVPDLNDYLNQAAVFVAPLRFAAGVQNKVLEAMAAGLPVVTTSVVNAGLGAQPGVEALIGDDAESISRHIVALLSSESLRMEIGGAGLRFVRRRYRWDQVSERVQAIEQAQTLRGSRSGPPQEETP
jgi:glycosyltransferase involved in cell wall biosynthesis